MLLLYNLHDEAKFIINKLLNDNIISNDLHAELDKFINLNLDSSVKIICLDILQLFFSFIIFIFGIFIPKYRTKCISYFYFNLRKLFYSFSNFFRFKGLNKSITHDLNL